MEKTDSIHTLPKSEKLCSTIATGKLFTKGNAFIKFPIRIVYSTPTPADSDVHCRILTSVPKKRFKHAVDRNRIKRLMREAYRLNKQTLVDALGDRYIDLAFICVDNNLPTFQQMNKAVNAALGKIANAIDENKAKAESNEATASN